MKNLFLILFSLSTILLSCSKVDNSQNKNTTNNIDKCLYIEDGKYYINPDCDILKDLQNKHLFYYEPDIYWGYKNSIKAFLFHRKYGFIDIKNFEICFPPILDKAYDFGINEEYAAIELNNKIGFINKDMKIVCPPKFPTSSTIDYEGVKFQNGHCVVYSTTKQCGLIDKKFNLVIDTIYRNISILDDAFQVEDTLYYYIIDSNYQIVNIDLPFDWLTPTHIGYIVNLKNDPYAILLDFDAKTVLSNRLFTNLKYLPTQTLSDNYEDEPLAEAISKDYLKYHSDEDCCYIGLLNTKTSKIISEPIWDDIYIIGDNIFAGRIYISWFSYFILFDSNGKFLMF